jgi:hypothetical protein
MSRELLQQALDALEQYTTPDTDLSGRPTRSPIDKSLCIAIRAHLAAQPAPVPDIVNPKCPDCGHRALGVGCDMRVPHLAAQPAPVPDLGLEWTPCVKLPITVHVRKQRPGEAHVSTREGITPVRPDDLIMRGVAGEEYPIGRELFERTYRIGDAAPVPVPLTEAERFMLHDAAHIINRAAKTKGDHWDCVGSLLKRLADDGIAASPEKNP